MASEFVIQAEKLTKYYGRARGIIEVDLSIYRGEVFGFLGPNGAGKSTTIRTMLDYIRPTSGHVLVNGMDPQKEGANVRRSVGYLPSDFGTYSSLSAREYLYTLLSMMDFRGKERIEELSKRFQLDLGRRIKDFSRGNRQKVGLVSAFMHSPDLVILDEPTTGLDPLMQQEFYKLIHEEKAAGRTIFLSSHILVEVETICDRVAIIKEGRLILTEKMSGFRSRTGKVMKVRFSHKANVGPFSHIKGVSKVEVDPEDDKTLLITISTGIDNVIKALADHTILDMDYEDVSLEDLFLHFYEDDDPNTSPEKGVSK